MCLFYLTEVNKLFIMKYIIQIALLLSMVCGSSYGQDSTKVANSIQLIISTDKSDYLEGENVWREWKLIIDKKVKLDYWIYSCQEFVTNSNKQGIPYHGWSYVDGFPVYDYPDTMCSFDVLDFGYYELPKPREIYQVGYYFPADEYEITDYVNVTIKGKQYKVEAKPVKFVVHKPEGEDLLARKEYLDLIPISWKDTMYWKDTSEYKSLIALKENYEKNPLLEQDINAYKSYIRLKEYLEMVSMLWKDTTDYKSLLFEKIDSFLVKYEKSVYIDKLLYTFGYPKKSIDVIEFYYNLILKHPEFAGNYQRLRSIMSIYNYKNDLGRYLKMIDDLESRFKDNEMFMKVLFYHKRDYQRELKSGLFK